MSDALSPGLDPARPAWRPHLSFPSVPADQAGAPQAGRVGRRKRPCGIHQGGHTGQMAEQQATDPAAAPTAPSQGALPLLGDLRRAGLLPALVLHILASGPSYGNQLMERIGELTGGVLAVNP